MIKKLISSLIKTAGLVIPSLVLATSHIPTPAIKKLEFKPDDIINFAKSIMNWAAILIGTLSALVILYAAFLFMTAGGDETKTGNAKKVLWYGIIGVIVMMVAFTIQTIIASFLGLTTTTP